MAYQICLTIKENLDEELASMVLLGHESFDDATQELSSLFHLIQLIINLQPGESYTLTMPDSSENLNQDPPRLVGADEDPPAVF